MVRPKKQLGQHFLRDDNIARRIVSCLDPAPPLVLEIGPGTGVLTRHLLAMDSIDPFFLEVDKESVEYLQSVLPAIKERLIPADFLRYDLATFPTAGRGSEPFQVIGNFPYNISSQILFRVYENRDRVPSVVGMFQKEVAERIASPPGSRKYGILSVILQCYYDIEYLFTVNETVFYPPPKVKSAVIRLRRNSRTGTGCSDEWFVKVVKTAFNQRRKTLRNSLKGLVVPGFFAAEEALGAMRPEQLSVQEFMRLAQATESPVPGNS